MTPTLPNPLPIILCGKTEQIGRRVAEIFRPEYEVIHFTLGYEAAAAEIKHVLAGQDPQTQNKNSVGTNDYSKPPRAVVLGRGLTPSDAEELRKTCVGINKEPVAWLVGDPAKAPTVPVGPEYGERVARESKNALDGWVKAGGINDGVIVW